MPQETKSSPGLPLNGVATPATLAADSLSVAGLTAELGGNDPAATLDILEKAFDYRGDVTITRTNGSQLTGYLFDRRRGTSLSDSYIRLMPPPVGGAGAADGRNDKIKVPYADIKHIAFSDRDPSSGKSFETWVKKYVEKKLNGEKASIESESLD